MPARKRRPVEDLSTAELRRLLMEKQRGDHQERLEAFQKTGRVIEITRDIQPSTLHSLHSEYVETAGEFHQGQTRTRAKRKTWFDGILLLVEVAAVAGLIFIMYTAFGMLRNLNTEASSVMRQSDITPTPLISAVVLPSGHTPPNSAGGAQPNEAEIPAHLRPAVQSLANIPIPTASPEQATRIQIPAIKVDAPVVQGDGWEQLKKGVGQHIGTVDPGDDGNMVLSAHNDVFGEIFRDLDKLKTGDEVILFTNARQYVYTVTNTQVVEPTFVEVMGSSGEPIVTLISCYPYLVDNQRIVISAALQK
jgi:sortase A